MHRLLLLRPWCSFCPLSPPSQSPPILPPGRYPVRLAPSSGVPCRTVLAPHFALAALIMLRHAFPLSPFPFSVRVELVFFSSARWSFLLALKIPGPLHPHVFVRFGVFIPHRVASNPLPRTRRTVLRLVHKLLLL